MKKHTIFLLIFFFSSYLMNPPLLAQKRLPIEVKKWAKQMVFIQGGDFVLGENGGKLSENNEEGVLEQLKIPPKQTALEDFYLAQFELTTQEWRNFYLSKKNELGEFAALQYLPDTLVWRKDFPDVFNEPLVNYYFWQSSYAEYPIVGITWHQAKAYCEWKTKQINTLLLPFQLQIPEIRLPTEAEWEYAAYSKKNVTKDVVKQNFFPWSGDIFNEKTKRKKNTYKANFGAVKDEKGMLIKSLADDGYIYTAPVKMYQPNEMNIYQMGGNVSEWVADEYRILDLENKDTLNKNKLNYQMAEAESAEIIFVYKGASFVDSPIYSLAGARRGLSGDLASSKIGFRIAISKNASNDVMEILKKMR